MPFPNIELPADFDVPRLQEKKSRTYGLANLRFGPGKGRPKGAQDKICRDLKEGILQGAILHGYDGSGQGGLIGYCLHLAERHPKAYASLLCKLLPYNLNQNVATAGISKVIIESIPSGTFLSKEQCEAATHPRSHTLELEAEPIDYSTDEPAITDVTDAPIVAETPRPMSERERIVAMARTQGWEPLPPSPRRSDW